MSFETEPRKTAESNPEESDFEGVWERIFEMLVSEEDYDREFRRPDAHAASKLAKDLLTAKFTRSGAFPHAAASTTGNGDISVTWTRLTRNLQLIVPSDRKTPPHLYWREGDKSQVVWDTSPQSINEWLSWVEGGNRSE